MAGVNPSTQSAGWSIHALEASSNALDAFQSEAAQAEKPRPADTPASERPPVSLAGLKADGIQLNGDEAVAIGRALCRVFTTMQLLRRVKPDANVVAGEPVTAHTVFIDGSSRVRLTVDVPYDIPTAIHSVGRILSDILPANTRLFIQTSIISKALASPPQFGSVDELSQALGAYEPANGKQLIEAIYERWEKRGTPSSTPAAVVPDKSPDKSPSIPLPLPDVKPVAPTSSGYQSAVLLGGATVAAVAMIVIGGSFFVGGWPAGRKAAVGSTPVLEARPIARMMFGYLPDVTPAWTARENEPVVVERPAPADRRGSRTASTSARRSPAETRPAVRSSSRPPTEVPAVAPRTATGSPAAAPTPVTRRADSAARQIDRPVEAAKAAGAPPAKSAADSPASPASAHVYDAGDQDVVPPVPVEPRLLAGLRPSSPGVRLDALVIAVVVNGDGKAGSVAAVNPPRNMGESVLLMSALSVVKGWRFAPATKDGAPVKYRLTVPLRAVTGP